MTSTYRRDHIKSPKNDEFDALTSPARFDIASAVAALNSLYPTPTPSQGEVRALQRAMARFLIDSGKASANGVLS